MSVIHRSVKKDWSCRRSAEIVLGVVLLAIPGFAAMTCQLASEMDPATRSLLESTAKRYFDMAAHGDSVSLRQNATSALASDFGGVEAAVNENKQNFSSAQTTVRPPFLLAQTGPVVEARADFYCGIYNSPDRVGFSIPNLAPGKYALVIQDVKATNGTYSVSMILEQAGANWKLAGYFVQPETIAGHDSQWYWNKAKEFKSKGQNINAYMYYVQARQLMQPVTFMGTPQLDKIYDETQQVAPKDLPTSGPVDQMLGTKSFKLNQVFPVPVNNELDLVVKYLVPDISDTSQVFQDNMAVIKGMVSKYPELREAFSAVVARAVAPNGQDYGSLLPMKDIK
ncbi:MAG TPA: hypothetical protein VFA76_02395 [Terriglobales bacterium]|nr:hypothetical protein [Terriglobales bacterium]